MAEAHTEHFDPVTHLPFYISKNEAVATAGSCFAQHISRALSFERFNYLVTEERPLTPGATDENFGVFSARFGNIYTIRQLLQLFDRAYGLFEPRELVWARNNGAALDPFRPRIQQGGFASPDQVVADREAHLAAVRRMFERCAVFIFTLGLTEAWVSQADGAVFPLAPGVVGVEESQARSVNFEAISMIGDLKEFIDKLLAINARVKVILTVSPVPLVATFENRHVLVSTTSSKASLRVAAEEVCKYRPEQVAYFPSYEIIMAGGYRPPNFADDLRSVTEEGVRRVMTVFRRHFLTEAEAGRTPESPIGAIELGAEDVSRMKAVANVICDEEAIGGSGA
ncbi:GSCFA domain-containing protein [Methylocystis sp. 9N]|uniref:GSCFA domain-containing protein n=1 Tax=Methylocystis borbori TaxID=3118750 RepID=A0ABU7XK46_9HYPH